MRHIKTVSTAETSMRKLHPESTDMTPARAEASHEESVRRIVELTKEMDLLKLEISKEIGSLMGYMQNHASLETAGGVELVKWANASDRSSVDWEGVAAEMNIPQSVIDRHTTVSRGNRNFTVIAD